MSDMLPDLEDTPAGYLLLGRDGSILHSPLWFDEMIGLRGDDRPSIFELFSPRRIPHLRLHRIYRHAHGSVEYHLRTQGLIERQQGLRYWPAQPPEGLVLEPGQSLYMLVDDTAMTQTHQWELDHLRQAVLTDVQDALSGHLKNRQTTLQLLVDMIREAPDLAEEAVPRLQRSVAELGSAINQIVTGIKDIASADEYRDTPVRLIDLPNLLASWGSSSVDVRCSLQGVNGSALLPASSIERIVLPVVDNAVDASSAPSTVEVILSVLDDDFAHFQIIDNGDGMDRRLRQRAPDPFFSTKVHHLGLGLAHARQALRQIGGQWKFDNAPDQGTRVVLLLPLT